jgi:hypothetical protein
VSGFGPGVRLGAWPVRLFQAVRGLFGIGLGFVHRPAYRKPGSWNFGALIAWIFFLSNNRPGVRLHNASRQHLIPAKDERDGIIALYQS